MKYLGIVLSSAFTIPNGNLKWNFSKTLFKTEELENAGFSYLLDGQRFENWFVFF